MPLAFINWNRTESGRKQLEIPTRFSGRRIIKMLFFGLLSPRLKKLIVDTNSSRSVRCRQEGTSYKLRGADQLGLYNLQIGRSPSTLDCRGCGTRDSSAVWLYMRLYWLLVAETHPVVKMSVRLDDKFVGDCRVGWSWSRALHFEFVARSQLSLHHRTPGKRWGS